jgi:hypothetical protein
MDCHNHDGCPHDHEGALCLYGDAGDGATPSTPDVDAEVIADAAVEISEIEAETQREAMELQSETERLRIAAELEHHELSNASNEDDNDTSVEHHQIVAAENDELEEVVEELVDEVIELEEILDGDAGDAGDIGYDEGAGDEEDLSGGDAVEVAPPPRVEAPNTSSVRSRSTSRGGNLRRGRR